MKRHLVHSVGAMLALLVCLSISSGRAEAQTGVPGAGLFNDPFTFYYAIYLPNQQLQSMRPTPLDSVNDAMVTRQYYTQQNRQSLYDPISPYAETYDPLKPFSNQQERRARPARFSHSPRSSSTGAGPALYFNRVSQYYPDLAGRTTTHRNANVSARRSGGPRSGGGMGGMGGGMGGMGMPGMGMF